MCEKNPKEVARRRERMLIGVKRRVRINDG
jgi:hypothetical protein